MRDIPIPHLTGLPHLWLFMPHVWKLPSKRRFARYLIGCTNELTGETTVARRIFYDPYVAAQYAVAFAMETPA